MSGSLASNPPEPVLQPGAGELLPQVVIHSLVAAALFVLNPAPLWQWLLLAPIVLNLIVQWRRIRRVRHWRVRRWRGGWWLHPPGGEARPVGCRYRFLSPLLVVMELRDRDARWTLALLPAAATAADWRHLHRIARAEWQPAGQG